MNFNCISVTGAYPKSLRMNAKQRARYPKERVTPVNSHSGKLNANSAMKVSPQIINKETTFQRSYINCHFFISGGNLVAIKLTITQFK